MDIFGWSRGAYEAIALAQKLGPGSKVRFLGLIDPSVPAKKVEGKDYLALIEKGIPANVHTIVVGVRGKDENSGFWGKVFDVGKVGGTVIVTPKEHLGTGFDRIIGWQMWWTAADVGVPFKGTNPFTKASGWSETPRGGWKMRCLEDLNRREPWEFPP